MPVRQTNRSGTSQQRAKAHQVMAVAAKIERERPLQEERQKAEHQRDARVKSLGVLPGSLDAF